MDHHFTLTLFHFHRSLNKQIIKRGKKKWKMKWGKKDERERVEKHFERKSNTNAH